MSTRKGWDDLSAPYRKRLEKGGISKTQYESGISLAKVRGHAETPEHPGDAYNVKNREKYRKYLEKAKELRMIIIGRKIQLFSNRFKWDPERAEKYVMEGGTEIPKPGRQQLEEALSMTDDEIEDLLHDPSMNEQWKFLWYH